MKEVNGCGAADGLLRFVKVPHSRFFECACNEHDKDYNKGGGLREKLKADFKFLKNMNYLITEYFGRTKERYCERKWFYIVSFINFVGVLVGGWFSFNWEKTLYKNNK